MRKATTALFVVLMFVFSCTKESVSPDLDAGNDVLKKADAAKEVSKTLKIFESSGTMGPAPNEKCDYGVEFQIQGTGHATHLGAFTVQNRACMDPDGNLLEPLQGVMTAANGDKIYTYVPKPPYVDERGLVYYYTIYDGTGRFKGAWGFIEIWGNIDYSTMTFDLQGLGEITY